jgi:hypothetical protein
MCILCGDFNARIGDLYLPMREFPVLQNTRNNVADISLNPRGNTLVQTMNQHVF